MSQTPISFSYTGALDALDARSEQPITDEEVVEVVGPPAAPKPPPDGPLRAAPVPYRSRSATMLLVDRFQTLIDIFYLITSVTCIAIGLFMIAESFSGTLRARPWGLIGGLLIATLGPLTLRVLCNTLAMISRVYQCLTDIEAALEERRGA